MDCVLVGFVKLLMSSALLCGIGAGAVVALLVFTMKKCLKRQEGWECVPWFSVFFRPELFNEKGLKYRTFCLWCMRWALRGMLAGIILAVVLGVIDETYIEKLNAVECSYIG